MFPEKYQVARGTPQNSIATMENPLLQVSILTVGNALTPSTGEAAHSFLCRGDF